MSSENTVINMSLLIWCFVVIAELFVLSWILPNGFVLLIGLVLFFPIRAAFKWTAPKELDTHPKKKAK